MKLMMLPAMASEVIKRAQNDPRTRITYSLTDFQIELSSGDRRILTFGTLMASRSRSALAKNCRKSWDTLTQRGGVSARKRTDSYQLSNRYS